jgi:Cu+-exporting ATPase
MTAERLQVTEGTSSELPKTLELAIGGMTCASCATRVEKKLNRMPGVSASVNLVTEKAAVRYAGGLGAADLVAELVATVQATGYTAGVAAVPDRAPTPSGAADRDDETRSLRRRLVVAVVFTLPIVVLAMVPAWQFDRWSWLTLVVAVPVVTWCAAPFHRAAVGNLRHGSTTMDTLISLGVAAAVGWSVYALLLGGAETYFEVATGVTTLLLAGRFLEARARRRAGAALRALLDLGVRDVAVLPEGEPRREVRIPIERLRVGDLFVVRPGEKVATDGVVETGTSAIDAALLTGESVPAEVGPGSPVAGATVNVGGRLVVRATGVGADTHLAQVGRLVEEAQNGKAAVQRLADRVSSVFVPAVLLIAAGTLFGWLLAGRPTGSVVAAAVAVLIVACPCALGLATPTALLVGTGRGAQLGILISGPEVLESTRRADVIVLDKTGTLTTGRLSLVDVLPAAGTERAAEDPAELLRVAAAVEAPSEHPVGRAVAAAAIDRFGAVVPVDGFASNAGRGVRAIVDGAGMVSVGQLA